MMKKMTLFAGLLALLCLFGNTITAQEKVILPPGYQPDTRIDNMGYWSEMARLGLVPVQPYTRIPAPVFTGTKVYNNKGVLVDDSPDVPETTTVTTQSENSIVHNPNDNMHILNSNNETSQPSSGSTNGADWYRSLDGGESWTGSNQGAGANNSGDPAACINMSGRYFIGFIDAQYGQSVSYSDDNGTTWTVSKVATGSMMNMLDKNHLWVDNSPTSPYNGNLYDGWMKNNQINVSYSNTNAVSWSVPVAISSGTAAGSHNQGENFKTGPDGEAYCVWSVYDSWPGDEKALGFSKSLDGGITWAPAVRIFNNIKGIRTTGVSQNQRVNSFPSMACDISNSPYRGTLYVIWPNIGVPGMNTGTDVDIYMIKSSDGGTTWSVPVKVNQDASGLGKKHYMSWITCDQANGQLSVVYYDNRNLPGNQCETWVSYSSDGGATWEDMKVSDVAFTPSPIPNMASGYMGDYLGITAYDGKAYPCWTDTRLGYAMTYVSPISFIIPHATVVYNANILNDQTYGNGNGQMDFGETELLGLTLENTGNAGADSVVATLSTDSPYITINDSTEFYGNFGIGETKTMQDAYGFGVSDALPGLTTVPFDVRTVDNTGNVTTSNFTLLSHGPALKIVGLTVSDPAGNNNGRLDPGEDAVLTIATKNPGDYSALDTESDLISNNPFVTIQNQVINLGTIAAGQTVNAVYNVHVSSNAYIGSAVVFHNNAVSGFQADSKDFALRIGLIVEDWETGNFNKFAWQNTSTVPWEIDNVVFEEGLYSSRITSTGENQSSDLMIDYNVLFDDSISFFLKTATKKFSGTLKFYIDTLMVGSWSGHNDWKNVAYPVLAGPHTFKWNYSTAAFYPTDTAVWTDFIVFPPEYKLSVFAGNDDSICAGGFYQVHGIALNCDSYLWTTSGTGTFDIPSNPDAAYTPSTQDISAGFVDLTFHGYGENQPETSSTMRLSISTPATVSAGDPGQICAGAKFTPGTSSGTNYATLNWTTSGDGSFNDATVLHPVYTPGPNDRLNGNVNLALTAGTNTVCPSVSDTIPLAIHAIPVVNLGPDTTLCSNLSYTLDATTQGAASYHWYPGGQTTAQITVDSTGIGISSRQFRVEVTSDYGCMGSDSAVVTFKTCGGIEEIPGISLNIYPNPSRGIFTIEIVSQKQEKVDISVISTSGVEVYSLKNLDVNRQTTRKIDLQTLPQGNYLLEFSNHSGKMIRKIMIQK